MRIQHNIAALNSYRQLNGNNNALSKNLEKLSSGYRINRAGDDAAGLAISEKMRAQIKGLEAAQKNAQDGISLVQTAEGALTEVHSMLNRMVYLATQSANGIYTDEAKGGVDRANLQDEVDSLLQEIDRIAKNTDFNGRKLLDGSLGSSGATTPGGTPGAEPTVAAPTNPAITGTAGDGSGTMASFSFDLAGASITAPTDGSTGAKATINVAGQDIEIDVTADMTAQDIADALNGQTITLRDTADANDMTFTASVNGTTVTFNTTDDFAIAAPSGNVSITGVAGTIGGADTPATAAVAAAGDAAGDGAAVKGQFTVDLTGVSVADTKDLVIGDQTITNNTGGALTGNALYTAIKGQLTGDVTIDGVAYTAAVDDTAGKITFTQKEDPTADGELKAADIAAAITNDGTAIADTAITIDAQPKAAGNGNTTAGKGLELQVGDSKGQTITVSIDNMDTASLKLTGLDISSQTGAQNAIDIIKDAIDTVSSQRGALGAVQNRLEHTINNLGVTTENITAAESRIRDTDMAEEMMAYTKNNILVQAAQAMLAQANTVPQGVLQLLQ